MQEKKGRDDIGLETQFDHKGAATRVVARNQREVGRQGFALDDQSLTVTNQRKTRR